MPRNRNAKTMTTGIMIGHSHDSGIGNVEVHLKRQKPIKRRSRNGRTNFVMIAADCQGSSGGLRSQKCRSPRIISPCYRHIFRTMPVRSVQINISQYKGQSPRQPQTRESSKVAQRHSVKVPSRTKGRVAAPVSKLELLEEIGFELSIGIHEAYSLQVDQLICVSKNMIFHYLQQLGYKNVASSNSENKIRKYETGSPRSFFPIT